MRRPADPPRRSLERARRSLRSLDRRWCARVVVFATVLSASAVLHGTASAQEPSPGAPSAPETAPESTGETGRETAEMQALWLARICVHEAGFHSPDDCRAIWRVLERGARRHRTTPLGFARRYSRTVFDDTRTDPRGWITRLDATGQEPAGFPATVEREVDGRRRSHRHPPWSGFRDDWLRTLAASRRIVGGELRARCRAPDDWGGPMDAERAARLGLMPLVCGETQNTFYARPRRVRSRARAVQIAH